MQLARPTGDSLKKPFSDVGEAPNCSPSSFRVVDVDPRPHEAVSVKEWLVQSVASRLLRMGPSPFHENLGRPLVSELIVDALSLVVVMCPFGMLLVERVYGSVF